MTEFCVLGDSIAKGIIFDEIRQKYALLNDNFIALLQKDFGSTFRNFASFGATTSKGSKILDKRYSNIKDYKYTLIEFGGNDCNLNWRCPYPQIASIVPKLPSASSKNSMSI